MASRQAPLKKDAKILFLHHSTGHNIWNGGIPSWFDSYNRKHGTTYSIVDQFFPKREPYGWANYPFDYWNIWVKNAGDKPYMEEPTLEILTRDFDVIMFKHCYPVAEVLADTGNPDVSSSRKSLENYAAQYTELKSKMHEFPDTRFIVWTGALLQETNDPDNQANALRAKTFFDWVRDEWDEPGDNVYIWDFAEIESGGGLYIRDEYLANPGDPHPSSDLSKIAAPFVCRRIVDVIDGIGDIAPTTGKSSTGNR